jgi:hypothetical protein
MAQSAPATFTAEIGQLTQLVTSTPYLSGTGFTVGAIMNFKEHADNPTSGSRGVPVSKAVDVAAALLFLPSILGVSMSCPVFVGPGTLLGEDACMWSKFTGDAGVQGPSNTQGLTWSAGGQFEVGPGWYLGGALATGNSWSQASPAPFGTERTIDAALVVKHVAGPLFLGVALGVSNATEQVTWPITLPGGGNVAMTHSGSTWNGGLMLRGAYEIPLDPVYVRPRIDVGLAYTSRSAVQSSGLAASVTVDPVSKIGVQASPMLEIGGRIDVGSTILRPYVAAGPTFMPDDSLHLSGTVAGRSYSGDVSGMTVMANVEAGVQLYGPRSWEAKLEYKLSAANQYLDQSLGLRLAKHF